MRPSCSSLSTSQTKELQQNWLKKRLTLLGSSTMRSISLTTSMRSATIRQTYLSCKRSSAPIIAHSKKWWRLADNSRRLYLAARKNWLRVRHFWEGSNLLSVKALERLSTNYRSNEPLSSPAFNKSGTVRRKSYSSTKKESLHSSDTSCTQSFAKKAPKRSSISLISTTLSPRWTISAKTVSLNWTRSRTKWMIWRKTFSLSIRP